VSARATAFESRPVLAAWLAVERAGKTGLP
jgi:hypothetical protein